VRPKHHQTHVEPRHVPARLAGECFACRTQVARTDEHDLRCFEHVVQLHDHLLGSAGYVFDPLLPLLVPEQQERDEHKREGQQDVGLDNVQEVQNQRAPSGHDAGDRIPVVAPQPVSLAEVGHASVCAGPSRCVEWPRRSSHPGCWRARSSGTQAQNVTLARADHNGCRAVKPSRFHQPTTSGVMNVRA
jgi:hypothetical protein